MKFWKGLIIFLIAFFLGMAAVSEPPKVEKVVECKYNEADVEELLFIDNKVLKYAGEVIFIFSEVVLSADVIEIEDATREIEMINSKLEIRRDQRIKLLEKMGLE